MIRLFTVFAITLCFVVSAVAQERVTVAAQRLADNGALFLADARGYFKAEGLEVEMTAYATEMDVAQAVASGGIEFGVAAYSPAAFDYAAHGFIRFLASQVEEKRGFEGNDIVASNISWASGLRRIEDLVGKSVAITHLGSPAHYQLGQLAQIKHFDLAKLTLKPLQTYDEIATALTQEKVQAAILPSAYAHELMVENQAKLLGWYSELSEQQLGALFANGKLLQAKPAIVEKFLRAYRRGAADYATMVQLDRQKKRVSTVQTREVATVIARYVYPGRPLGRAAAAVEFGAFAMDPQARIDMSDLARQIEWYKGQKLIDANADPKEMVDEMRANAH